MSDFTDADRATLERIYNLVKEGYETTDPAHPPQPLAGSESWLYNIIRAQLAAGSDWASKLKGFLHLA